MECGAEASMISSVVRVEATRSVPGEREAELFSLASARRADCPSIIPARGAWTTADLLRHRPMSPATCRYPPSGESQESRAGKPFCSEGPALVPRCHTKRVPTAASTKNHAGFGTRTAGRVVAPDRAAKLLRRLRLTVIAPVAIVGYGRRLGVCSAAGPFSRGYLCHSGVPVHFCAPFGRDPSRSRELTSAITASSLGCGPTPGLQWDISRSDAQRDPSPSPTHTSLASVGALECVGSAA